jgi:hypothetical protein
MAGVVEGMSNELNGAEFLRSQNYDQVVKKFSAFYGSRKFTEVFTKAGNESLF